MSGGSTVLLRTAVGQKTNPATAGTFVPVVGDSVAQWLASWLATSKAMGLTFGPRAPGSGCELAVFTH